MAYVLEIVVFPADAHAFLAGSCPLVGARFVPQEDILKLIHACISEQERRIVKRNQRRAGYNPVAVTFEVF